MFINVNKKFKIQDLLLYGTLRRMALLKESNKKGR